MSMSRFEILLFAAVFFLFTPFCEAQHPNLGRQLTPEEISKLDITVAPDGNGLPPGSGSVSAGAKVYTDKCQSCHGANGQGGPQDQLTGGVGTITSGKPVKTPVSYWPSAMTLFVYVVRAVPIQSQAAMTVG